MPSVSRPFYQDTIYTPVASDTVPRNRDTSVKNPDSADPSVVTSTTASPVIRTNVLKKQIQQETEVQEVPSGIRAMTPEKWNSSTNFLVENGLKGIVSGISKKDKSTITYGTKQQPASMVPRERDHYTYDWLLGIFLFLVILFVWIRVFYSKFFATLASALVSFQLSVKLFQERNVLSHRVSIVLDFIYIIVTSVFIFELIEYTGFAETGLTGINLFLLLLNILMIYAILRVGVLRMTGSLFMVSPLFSEYIHNTFVINKGLGIVLFPIVIMAHYLPYKIIPIMLVLGIALFAFAILYKSFRAYQIIIRRDILIFYLILYLCTLEILPLLLGYKFVTALIQSN